MLPSVRSLCIASLQVQVVPTDAQAWKHSSSPCARAAMRMRSPCSSLAAAQCMATFGRTALNVVLNCLEDGLRATAQTTPLPVPAEKQPLPAHAGKKRGSQTRQHGPTYATPKPREHWGPDNART